MLSRSVGLSTLLTKKSRKIQHLFILSLIFGSKATTLRIAGSGWQSMGSVFPAHVGFGAKP